MSLPSKSQLFHRIRSRVLFAAERRTRDQLTGSLRWVQVIPEDIVVSVRAIGGVWGATSFSVQPPGATACRGQIRKPFKVKDETKKSTGQRWWR